MGQLSPDAGADSLLVVTALNAIVAAMPSSSALAQQLMTGAIGTVIVSGLQSQGGQNALDPLHLIFKPNTTTTTGATTTSTPTPTITAAAFAALPASTQQMLLAQGAHIS